jgi:hypothetical protein
MRAAAMHGVPLHAARMKLHALGVLCDPNTRSPPVERHSLRFDRRLATQHRIELLVREPLPLGLIGQAAVRIKPPLLVAML